MIRNIPPTGPGPEKPIMILVHGVDACLPLPKGFRVQAKVRADLLLDLYPPT